MAGGPSRCIRQGDVQLVHYFADKYRRLAAQARGDTGEWIGGRRYDGRRAAVSLDDSAKEAAELAGVLERMIGKRVV